MTDNKEAKKNSLFFLTRRESIFNSYKPGVLFMSAGQYSHKWRRSLHQGTVPYSTMYFCHFFHDVLKFCLPNGRQEMASI